MAKRPINVEVKPKNPNEPFERIVRRFVKKVKKQRVLEKYRERMYYEKPSDKKRKNAANRKKTLEKLRRERENRIKSN